MTDSALAGSTTEQLSRACASGALIKRLRATAIVQPVIERPRAGAIMQPNVSTMRLLWEAANRIDELEKEKAHWEWLARGRLERIEELEAQVAEGESAGMTIRLADTIDVMVQGICEDCDDETGERMFEALEAIGPRNNATMTMHCAQIIAGQLMELEEGDQRDGYWTAFGRLVLLCINTP